MKFTDKQLKEAVKNGVFSPEQAEAFKAFVRNSDVHSSRLLKLLYYGGAFLMISAMTWLIGTSLYSLGRTGMVIFVSLYLLVFFVTGNILFFRKKLEIAGGVVLSVSIAMVTTAIPPCLPYSAWCISL